MIYNNFTKVHILKNYTKVSKKIKSFDRIVTGKCQNEE